jgi:hypothetical protein
MYNSSFFTSALDGVSGQRHAQAASYPREITPSDPRRGQKDFSSSLCVQTGSEAHSASCTMSTGGPFPGGKSAAGAWRWPLTPSSAEVENE